MKEKLTGILIIAVVFFSMCTGVSVKGLTVSKFVFCTEVQQNGQYTPRSNAEFAIGESIYVYFELEGVETKEENNQYLVSLKWEYLKIYKNGTLADEKYNVLSYDQSFDSASLHVWMARPIAVSGPGNYEAEIKVVDNYSGKEITSKENFKISAGSIEEVTPAPTIVSTGKDIDVTYYYFLKVSSATYHLFGNVYEHYVDVEITNNANEEVRTKVEVQIMNFTDTSFQTIDIPAGEMVTVSLTPPLMLNVLDTLSEQKRTNFHIKVTYIEAGEEKIVFEDTQSVTMLAKRDMVLWMQNFDFRENIAAWVTPNDPFVDQFFSAAKKYMPGGTFVGSQADEGGIEKQVEKIYYTLKKDYKVSYVSTPDFRIYNNEEDVIQRIRFPSETLKSGIGNCIETTVLFASLLEALQLNTAIILRPGHAYVAYQNHEYWYFIETTLLGEGDVTFYDALRIGLSNYNEDKSHLNNNEIAYRTIFIDDCRDAGISPIEG